MVGDNVEEPVIFPWLGNHMSHCFTKRRIWDSRIAAKAHKKRRSGEAMRARKQN
ncbi:hypothetical protein [Novosphingobium terrae]|uniref:hypothetical protein n=1 Tax=Novosphingobium terrae TaxID=2726189 RepID=UPI00197EDF16|nr:hypothetical protein [Novosphingobium terrae]